MVGRVWVVRAPKFGGCGLAKNLAPYRIGKRPHKQNRAKIHQKIPKIVYFFSIFDVFLSYFFEGCCVFLSCRGRSLSQRMGLQGPKILRELAPSEVFVESSGTPENLPSHIVTLFFDGSQRHEVGLDLLRLPMQRGEPCEVRPAETPTVMGDCQ